MRCRRVRGELLEFINNSLDGESRRAISEHLWTCPRCAEEEERLRSVALVLGRLQPEVPSPRLLFSTREKLEGARREMMRKGQRLLRRAWRLSPAALLGVVGLVVASGLLMAHSSSGWYKARELRQLQQRVHREGLIRQVALLREEMPQLADQMVLASAELVLREIVNLDPRSGGEEGIRGIQRRITSSRMRDSLGSLERRAGGGEKKVLADLLLCVQEIEAF